MVRLSSVAITVRKSICTVLTVTPKVLLVVLLLSTVALILMMERPLDTAQHTTVEGEVGLQDTHDFSGTPAHVTGPKIIRCFGDDAKEFESLGVASICTDKTSGLSPRGGHQYQYLYARLLYRLQHDNEQTKNDSILNSQKSNLLEIGLGCGMGAPFCAGGGMRLFQRFIPRTKYISVELFPLEKCQRLNLSSGERRHLKEHSCLGSVEGQEALESCLSRLGPFDIIVDDASHNHSHVMSTLEHVVLSGRGRKISPHRLYFTQRLTDGGTLIIEDLFSDDGPPPFQFVGGGPLQQALGRTVRYYLRRLTLCLLLGETSATVDCRHRRVREISRGLSVLHVSYESAGFELLTEVDRQRQRNERLRSLRGEEALIATGNDEAGLCVYRLVQYLGVATDSLMPTKNSTTFALLDLRWTSSAASRELLRNMGYKVYRPKSTANVTRCLAEGDAMWGLRFMHARTCLEQSNVWGDSGILAGKTFKGFHVILLEASVPWLSSLHHSEDWLSPLLQLARGSALVSGGVLVISGLRAERHQSLAEFVADAVDAKIGRESFRLSKVGDVFLTSDTSLLSVCRGAFSFTKVSR